MKKNQAAKLNSVAIIGCEHVGATNAYSLLMNGSVEDLILVGKNGKKLLGEIQSLQNALPLARQMEVRRGSMKDAARAAIVVISAGVRVDAKHSPLETLSENARTVREIAGELRRYQFDGIMLMITYPVDILTRIAQVESGLPANRVIGSGTVLETSRRQIGSSPLEVGMAVEQDESNAATWCAARVGSSPLIDFCTPDCPDFEQMLVAVRRAATDLSHRQNRSSFAAGSCVNRICEAILRDERAILPVSVLTNGEYGISGVFLNLPSVIGRGGVEKIVEFELEAGERKALHKSAAVLKAIYENLQQEEKFSAAGTA